jgi:hypothetical protein
MRNRRNIYIIIGAIIVFVIVLSVFLLTRKNTKIPTLTLKNKNINQISSIIAYKNKYLYYISEQSLYKYNGTAEKVSDNVTNAEFISNNELLYTNYAKVAGPVPKVTSYLYDVSSNKTLAYENTSKVLYCNSQKYFQKPTGYDTSSLVDSNNKIILKSAEYSQILCISNTLVFALGEGDQQNPTLYTLNLITLKPDQKLNLSDVASNIYNSSDYMYYNYGFGIRSYNKQLNSNTFSNSYFPNNLPLDNSNEIYYVQPPIKKSNSENMTVPYLAKYSLVDNSDSLVAYLKLPTDLTESIQTNGGLGVFDSVVFDSDNNNYYVLVKSNLYIAEGNKK